MTGVPLKQVHRIIDAGLLGTAKLGGARSRAVHRDALVGLKLAHDTMDLITLDGRRRLVRYLLDHPGARTARERGVSVDLRAMKDEVRRGLSRLARARDAVECDEAVLSGAPCFRGTRIPVHDIADMLVNGDTAGAIHEAFPQLSKEQIELAAFYARAYPRRGRPRRRPFRRAQAGRDDPDRPTTAAAIDAEVPKRIKSGSRRHSEKDRIRTPDGPGAGGRISRR